MKLASLVLASLLLVSSTAEADLVNPAGFTESTWLAIPDQITGMAWAPDGSNRLFITRKGGEVRIVQRNAGGGATLLAAPFATISPVETNSECGVIGIAFDPDFVTNGYVYFFVTVSTTEQQIIRYTASGNTGTAKTTIVPGLPTVGENHDGGGIGFGADGHLYWSIGDLGNGTGVDQDLTSLAAKVGRATRTGAVPSDNPYVDGPSGNADFIFAQGFRNPFTLTFQPTTGLLWVNVVGTSYEQIFVVRSGDHAGYNDYENNQPAGYITPTITYQTGSSRTLNITASGATRAGGVVTFTTTAGHRLRQGERVVVAGVTDTSFNGTFYVATGSTAPGATTFTVAQAGPNASSGAGTVTTMDQGRTVSGGAFYDATAFPPAYRGNFFYGDFIDNRLMRAVVGPSTTVQSVDYWSTNRSSPIDNAIGPDGALYTASYGGTIYRTVYNSPTQNLIVSNQNVRLLEGGAFVVTVSLATAPAANVTVDVGRTAGDADVGIGEGATLTFTPTNYMDPQSVRIEAMQDADSDDDTATLTVSSSGLASHDVTARVVDDDLQAIVLSRTSMTIPESSDDTFTVHLSRAPGTAATVNVMRSAGDTDVTVSNGAVLVFTPANFATPQTVTVAAADDAGNTDDMATLTISTPGAPPRTLEVVVTDDEDRAPVITSTPDTSAVTGALYTYDVEGNGVPTPTYALGAAPAGMTIDAATGVISFTPTTVGTFAVSVVAQNGVLPDDTQTFDLVVSADAAPTASITSPEDGDTVSGETAEFYGDGFDDIAAVRAEFYIDDVLVYTDPGSMGHFHINGGHQLWDTTTLADGPHTLRMVVYDASEQSGSDEVTVTVDNGAVVGDGGMTGGDGGGCGCRATSRTRDARAYAIALALMGLVTWRRRRR